MESNVIEGPPLSQALRSQLTKSLSQYLIECAQTHQQSSIFMIDSESEKTLTYRDTIDKSYILAASLQSLGCKKGTIVGIMSENRLEYPIVLLAALHAGAILTTFNPAYSTGELEHTVGLTRPEIIFCTEKCVPKIVEISKIISIRHIISIDHKSDKSPLLSYNSLIGQFDKKFEPVYVEPNSVAFILFSSGTTGYPKGVMWSHSQSVHCLELVRTEKLFEMQGRHVVLLVPIFHAYGLCVTLLSFVMNKTQITFNRFDPKLFLSVIQKYKPKFLLVVPPILTFLVKNPMVTSYDTSSIRIIYVGAAPFSKSLSKEMKSKFKLDSLIQLYGLTEATVFCTGDKGEGHHGSVGFVCQGMKAKVVDIETGEALPAMGKGELCFKGHRVMLGYYNNVKETNETIDSDGWLHTGDIGYYDDEGYFYVVDRLKELIKYKGYQVAPAELEAFLLKHGGIYDAAVIGIPDEEAGELPKAYVVKKPGVNLTEKDVIDYVAGSFSYQKRLKGGVTFIDEIPKNASGKILRKNLRNLVKPKL